MSPTSASDVKIAPVASVPPAPPKLLDSLRQAIRLRHYSIRTEDTYVDWVRRFICSTASATRETWAPRSWPPS